MIPFNINANRIVFVYQCLEHTFKGFLSIHCRRWITNYASPCLDLRSKNQIDVCPNRSAYLFNTLFCKTFWLCHDPSCKVVWWRSFSCLYLMTKNSIIYCIKPIFMHPCFICIYAVVITKTVISALNVTIFSLAEHIFMW